MNPDRSTIIMKQGYRMEKSLPILVISHILFFGLITSCGTESDPIYQLSVEASPAEGGTITPASGEFQKGETVTLVPTANENYAFSQWAGDGSGTETTFSMTMNSHKHLVGKFIKRDYELTVRTIGEGTVTERMLTGKTTNYPHGAVVELTAIPEDG